MQVPRSSRPPAVAAASPTQLNTVGHNRLQPALHVGGHSAGPHDLEPGEVVHSTDVYGTVNSEHTILLGPSSRLERDLFDVDRRSL